MTERLYPEFLSIVDTEQTITRSIQLVTTDGDDRYDIQAPYRAGTFRPISITLYYRVNRGASVPYWYLFSAKIRAGKVLKSGAHSVAHQNTIAETYAPERLPQWARALGADFLPLVEVERVGFSRV